MVAWLGINGWVIKAVKVAQFLVVFDRKIYTNGVHLLFLVRTSLFTLATSDVAAESSTSILSSKAPEPVGLYPHARRVGNLLFLSGVGPRQRGSAAIPGVELNAEGIIVSYDIETQCRSVFQNVRMILEEAGSRWENLVDVTVFLTNMKHDFSTYNRVYAEHFQTNQPCRTTVEVTALPTPIAIELKCIATIE
jgi:2-aminomuconate deaminase